MERGRVPLRIVPELAIGDDDAPEASSDVETAFRLYSRYVAGVAVRLLGRDDEVDDVVQDVFLSALRGLRDLRDPGAIRGWLATVTVRVAQRKLRFRRLRSFVGLDDAHDYAELVVPGTAAEHRLLLMRVYSALDRVPAEKRIAWTLRYVNGDDLETIAKMCDCSLATVKRRIAAAHTAVEGMVSDA